jgi:hypothetical protein
VDDDKKRLIVGSFPVLFTLCGLSIQDFRELQVVTIVNGFLNFHKSLPKNGRGE